MRKLGLIALSVLSLNIYANDSVEVGSFPVEHLFSNSTKFEASLELSNVQRPYVKVSSYRRTTKGHRRHTLVKNVILDGLFIHPETRELRFKGNDGDYICGRIKRVPVIGHKYLSQNGLCRFDVNYEYRMIDDGLNVRKVKFANIVLNLTAQ